MRKKGIIRFLAGLIISSSVLVCTGCTEFFNAFLDGLSSLNHTYTSDEWNPSEDGADSTDFIPPSEPFDEMPTPKDPDENKQLLSVETDDIGHKIAYYADGTKEDLGREERISFAIETPEYKYGYNALLAQEHGAELCALYNDLYNVAIKFHYSEKTAVKVGGHYELAELNYKQYGLTQEQASAVWRVANNDYPEFFWWDNYLLSGKTSITLLADGEYATAEKRNEAKQAIEEMALKCDYYIDGARTLVERALTIHDYVASITAYSFKEDGVTPSDEIWAHNLAGGAQYGLGVCETYAKSYAYLCNLFQIESMVVTGYATENGKRIGHAWNIIKLGDSWYNVDPTWNDGDGSSLSRQWFATETQLFNELHQPFAPTDGWSVNYQVELPKTAEKGLSPVRAVMEKSGVTQSEMNSAPMYENLEEVIELATGSGVTYAVVLYPTTTPMPSARIIGRGATIYQTEIPENCSLDFFGVYVDYDNGYYSLAQLNAPNGLSLSSNITLRDVCLSSPSLQMNECTITTLGSAAELEIQTPITGNLTETSGCGILARSSLWTAVSELNVYLLNVNTDELRMLGGGNVKRAEIHKGNLRLYGSADTSIENLWFSSADEQLYIDNTTNETTITIGDITAGSSSFFRPSQVTFLVAYGLPSEYPCISVNSIQSRTKLYLGIYSQETELSALGRKLVQLSNSFSISSLSVGYSSGGAFSTLNSSKYEKRADGGVYLR